jgi:hypothetical protein
MDFQKGNVHIEETVEDNEVLANAVKIARERHARQHKPGDFFRVGVVEEEGSPLEQKQAQQKQPTSHPLQDAQPRKKEYIPTEKDSWGVIGCTCGWKVEAKEVLQASKEAEKKREGTYSIDDTVEGYDTSHASPARAGQQQQYDSGEGKKY